MTALAFWTGLVALVATFLNATADALRAQGRAREREAREKRDAELQKHYDEIARSGLPAGGAERMLDEERF